MANHVQNVENNNSNEMEPYFPVPFLAKKKGGKRMPDLTKSLCSNNWMISIPRPEKDDSDQLLKNRFRTANKFLTVPLPIQIKIEDDAAEHSAFPVQIKIEDEGDEHSTVIQPNPQFKGLAVAEPPENDYWMVSPPRPADDNNNHLRVRLVKRKIEGGNDGQRERKYNTMTDLTAIMSRSLSELSKLPPKLRIKSYFIQKAKKFDSQLKKEVNGKLKSPQGRTFRPRKAKMQSPVEVQPIEPAEPPAPLPAKQLKVTWVEEGDGRPASRWVREI